MRQKFLPIIVCVTASRLCRAHQWLHTTSRLCREYQWLHIAKRNRPRRRAVACGQVLCTAQRRGGDLSQQDEAQGVAGESPDNHALALRAKLASIDGGSGGRKHTRLSFSSFSYIKTKPPQLIRAGDLSQQDETQGVAGESPDNHALALRAKLASIDGGSGGRKHTRLSFHCSSLNCPPRHFSHENFHFCHL